MLVCCAIAEGPMEVNMTEVPIEEIELQLKQLGIQFGGHWKPKDCRPRWKVLLPLAYVTKSQKMTSCMDSHHSHCNPVHMFEYG